MSTDATTIVPGSEGAGARIRGRNTTLPGSSAGQLVDRAIDRYEVLGRLGAGGMGEVDLVKDNDIDRTVALKLLHPEMASPPMVARFVEEIRHIGKLEHPNIVPIHDAGRDEAGRYFFVMKHVDGETLETIIDRLRAGDPDYVARFPFLERVEIFIGILNALRFAHQKGLIHRDVKPSNVMVGRAGEVVLMDWGLSKSIGAPEPELPTSAAREVQTQTGTLIGTPAYMSPEQAEGRNEELDPRSDLYSAMALFHELMFLEHYLDGRETVEEICRGVLIASPRASWQSYLRYQPAPPPYLHICVKGMRKDPSRRFQTADELIAALRRVQDGTAPIQCPATAMRRAATEYARLVDRRPGLAMVISLAGVAALLSSLAALAILLIRLV